MIKSTLRELTVVGYWHEDSQSFVYHFDANDARDAAKKAHAYAADYLLSEFQSDISADKDVEPLDYDEALEIATNTTTIVAVFDGHHVNCLHKRND